MSNYFMKIIIVALIIVFAFVMQNWRTKYYDYQCGKCDRKFNLPVPIAVLSIHFFGYKYVKCPNCGKWGWVRPVGKG